MKFDGNERSKDKRKHDKSTIKNRKRSKRERETGR